MFLVFDTETTGIFNRDHPPGSPVQPHVCQLGAHLFTEQGRIVAELNLLVRPQNWGIPPEATAIHGISTEMCAEFGLPIVTVVKLFAQFVKRSQLLVAHNFPFDKNMLWTEMIRAEAATELAIFLEKPSFCTMQESTPVLKLPGKYGDFKWPNLQQAHQHFLGCGFEGAHDAAEDVRACARVFFEMKKRGLVPDPAPVSETSEF